MSAQGVHKFIFTLIKYIYVHIDTSLYIVHLPYDNCTTVALSILFTKIHRI